MLKYSQLLNNYSTNLLPRVILKSQSIYNSINIFLHLLLHYYPPYIIGVRTPINQPKLYYRNFYRILEQQSVQPERTESSASGMFYAIFRLAFTTRDNNSCWQLFQPLNSLKHKFRNQFQSILPLSSIIVFQTTRSALSIKEQIMTQWSTTELFWIYSIIQGQISNNLTSPISQNSLAKLPNVGLLLSPFRICTKAAIFSLFMVRSFPTLRLFLRNKMNRKKDQSSALTKNQLNSLISQLQVLQQFKVQKNPRTKLPIPPAIFQLWFVFHSLRRRCSWRRALRDLFLTAFHPPITKNSSFSSYMSSIIC